VYQEDLEQLALKYSLRKVLKALRALRIKAGQSFFPRPDEVAQEIEIQQERAIAKDIYNGDKDYFDRQRRNWEICMRPEEIAWRREKFGYDPLTERDPSRQA
jgi:hypothetical protein